MKTREKIALKLLAAVIVAFTAMAGSSFTQSMSDVQVGSFTLPFEAHWGTLDLKPGAYSFSVKNENGMDLVVVKQNNRQVGLVVATIFTGLTEATGASGGELLCAHHAGTAVISALDVPWKGVYHFYVPRGASPTSVAQMSNPTDSVRVLFAQK
jgi:hypothetical protein